LLGVTPVTFKFKVLDPLSYEVYRGDKVHGKALKDKDRKGNPVLSYTADNGGINFKARTMKDVLAEVKRRTDGGKR
jgi:hypothetical protein